MVVSFYMTPQVDVSFSCCYINFLPSTFNLPIQSPPSLYNYMLYFLFCRDPPLISSPLLNMQPL